MKTKGTILLSCIISLFVCSLMSQTRIDGDLLYLAKLTFEKSPLIERNGLQIDQAQANLLAQHSVFDYQFSSGYNISKSRLTPFDADPRNQLLLGNIETNNSDFFIGIQKKFRTGLIADLSSNYASVRDNFPLNRFSEDVGPNLADKVTSATFALTQPLLRGNGLKVATAFEKSAELDIESAHQSFELNSAFELSQLGSTYWHYLGAYKSLEIFKANENRVRNVLDITLELVQADKKPESDLLQIKADLADQERQTTVADQNLYASRVNLGRVIGLSEEESVMIGNPTNDFPTIAASGFRGEKMNSKGLIELGRTNRTDVMAIATTQKGLELQLAAAKNSKLPQLDITGFLTYGGAAAGAGFEYLNAFGNHQGRNSIAGLGLTFSLPLNNNQAKANIESSKISLSDQRIAYENLIRNIGMNVSIAVNNLENSVLILKKAEETLAYYQQVFENEQTKFQNGLTTLLNLILFQERLTFAQLEHLQAQQQFAVALLNLRFETGTLFSMNANNSVTSIRKEAFYTIPNNN